VIAAQHTSLSPVLLTIFGAVLAIFGGVLAADYRGWGVKYIQLGLPRRLLNTERRQRVIKIYRVLYGVAAVVGCLIVLGEVFGHS
jgi:hypothetical protein